MLGWNELIFLGHLTAAGVVLLVAARLGRMWVIALVVTCTILMNVAVTKNLTLFGLAVTGGNVLYATVFLANDVLNEHFGKRDAQRAVLTGFGAGLAVVVLMQFVLWYAPNDYDQAEPHLRFFFDVSMFPRIVAASMLSYLLAQLLDVRLYRLILRWTGEGRLLWLRSNGSTWISQAFDTVLFTTAGLTGNVIRTWEGWWQAVLFAYVVKILAAALDTPFLYLTTWRPLVPVGSRRSSLAPAGATQ